MWFKIDPFLHEQWFIDTIFMQHCVERVMSRIPPSSYHISNVLRAKLLPKLWKACHHSMVPVPLLETQSFHDTTNRHKSDHNDTSMSHYGHFRVVKLPHFYKCECPPNNTSHGLFQRGRRWVVKWNETDSKSPESQKARRIGLETWDQNFPCGIAQTPSEVGTITDELINYYIHT